ncbi:MAG: type II secretion system F family protein [Vulcanimicrobiota bacterium]
MREWRGKQKAIFFRGLSVLLNSGVHIIQALDSLAQQSIDEAARRTVEGISTRISSGFPLHKAMQAERVFSALEVGLVRVGERSGSLHSILQRLADATEAQDGLRRKLAAALVYPARPATSTLWAL